LFGIRKAYNPKAMGLFLSGYVSLYKSFHRKDYLDKISYFTSKILDSSTPGYSGQCWGYNFDWESRAFFLPEYTPTIVVSSYVANALLDAYEVLSDEILLKTARSTCDFILNDLNRTYDDKGNYIFSYSKFDNSAVYNASLLGSRLLARVYYFTGEPELKAEAERSAASVCDVQNSDGSWAYGRLPFHQWIDNFHTGFNLECISDYMEFCDDKSFLNNLQKGFDYYSNTFFTREGVSKYYNNSVYPVDIHAPAQLVITVFKLGKFNDNRALVNNVLNWTIKNMQSCKGYFYYQVRKRYKIKISYMRWSQAWMFYALSTYLSLAKNEKDL
jgi:rhamnogalacturonyl hydrolase YesR